MCVCGVCDVCVYVVFVMCVCVVFVMCCVCASVLVCVYLVRFSHGSQLATVFMARVFVCTSESC